MDDTTYSEDLKIDKDDLDGEWVKQPSLFMKWSESLANAIFERDKKKANLELKYSQIDGAARLNPFQYGIEKVTDAAVKGAVTSNEGYINLQHDYLEAVKDTNILTGAKTAMEHRRTALEMLTKLFLSGYYQTSNVVPDGIKSKAREEDRVKSSRRLREKLNKRKIKRVRNN